METVTLQTDRQDYLVPMLGSTNGSVSWTYSSTVASTTKRTILTRWSSKTANWTQAVEFAQPQTLLAAPGATVPQSGNVGPWQFELNGDDEPGHYRIRARLQYYNAAEGEMKWDGKASPIWHIDVF